MSCESWESNAAYDIVPMPEPGDHLHPIYCYLGEHMEKYLTHPYASPLFGDFKGLPPMLIQAGEAEVLRDEITLLAHKASLAGVDIRHELYVDMVSRVLLHDHTFVCLTLYCRSTSSNHSHSSSLCTARFILAEISSGISCLSINRTHRNTLISLQRRTSNLKLTRTLRVLYEGMVPRLALVSNHSLSLPTRRRSVDALTTVCGGHPRAPQHRASTSQAGAQCMMMRRRAAMTKATSVMGQFAWSQRTFRLPLVLQRNHR